MFNSQSNLESLQKRLEGKTIVAVDFETNKRDGLSVVPSIMLHLNDGGCVEVTADAVEGEELAWLSLKFDDKDQRQLATAPSEFAIRKTANSLDLTGMTFNQKVGEVVKAFRGSVNRSVVAKALKEMDGLQ